MNYPLSLCLLTRDENEYLSEWLDYHILMGVAHFFIYDNNSQVPVRQTLADYLERGCITVIELEGDGVQMLAYDHCLHNFGWASRWIGFIDTDEFLVPKAASDLPALLAEYERFAGLAVSSVIFGSGGHRQKPDGGQILNYRKRIAPHLERGLLIKSLVQPNKVLLPINPHEFVYLDGEYAVNERWQRVDDQKSLHYSDRVQINHYYCRSEAEFIHKQQRGRGDAGKGYQLDDFAEVDLIADIDDANIFEALGRTLEVTLQPDFLDILAAARRGDGGQEFVSALHQLASQRACCSEVPLPVGPLVRSPDFEFYWSLFKQAEASLNANDLQTAEQALNQIAQSYPTCVQVQTRLLRVLLAQKKTEAAWQVLQATWQHCPGSYELLTWFRTYYFICGDYLQAEQLDRQLLALAGADFRIRANLIADLTFQKRLDLVVDLLIDFSREYAGAPSLMAKITGDFEIFKRIGVYLYEQRELEKAVQVFEFGLQCSPEDLDLLVNLGRVYYEIRKYSAALEVLEKASRLNPADEDIQMGIRMAKRKLG